MKNRINWFILTAVLLGLTGCTRHLSEARVTVFNKGELTTYVDLVYSHSTIAPGKSFTFFFAWPGRDALESPMVSYPVNQSGRSLVQVLVLNDRDIVTVNVDFKIE